MARNPKATWAGKRRRPGRWRKMFLEGWEWDHMDNIPSTKTVIVGSVVLYLVLLFFFG